MHGERNIRFHKEWDKPGAKVFIIPAVDTSLLLSDAGKVIRRFSAIRVTPIGDTYTGFTNGIIDDMVLRKSALEVFGQFAQDFIEYTKLHAKHDDGLRYTHSWIAIFDVDPEKETLIHLGPIDMNSVMMKIGA